MKIFLAMLLIFLTIGAGAQDTKTLQSFAASFTKEKFDKTIERESSNVSSEKIITATRITDRSTLIGSSIIPVAFDADLGINAVSINVTKKHLNKKLFGLPQYTATYFNTEYDATSNLVENTYVQFVSDSKWNRLLFGSLNGSLGKYTQIKNPGKIVINSAGYLFVADRGNSRVQVLKINGKNSHISLEHLYDINKVGTVSALAYNDGGTPFDLQDDFLFIADGAANVIHNFKVTANSAQKTGTFYGFKWPVSIVFGRANGAHSNAFYVIDNYSKRITLYNRIENEIVKKITLIGQPEQTFSSLETDYFGQVYIADHVNNEISKYTADLAFLDAHQAVGEGFSDLNIPFGTIKLQNGEKHWVGFDQLLAIQNWTETTGVQRYKLATRVRDFTVDISAENVISHFTITDYSKIKLRLEQGGKLIYEGPGSQIASGKQNIYWDRRAKQNQQAAPGNYNMYIEFESIYDNAIQSKSASFYLPLYYHIDCGNEDETAAISLIKGNAHIYNGIKVIEDNGNIEYKVSGLNPESEYQISINHAKGNGQARYQDVLIDGLDANQSVFLDQGSVETDYIYLNPQSYLDGEIDVAIRNPEGGLVTISDIYIKETGQSFAINYEESELPAEYSLGQNYPNPFNPVTKIEFSLPLTSNVRLIVFDTLGKKVSNVLNEPRSAGRHSVDFDGSNLASGIYFYRLEAGSFREVKRMLILK